MFLMKYRAKLKPDNHPAFKITVTASSMQSAINQITSGRCVPESHVKESIERVHLLTSACWTTDLGKAIKQATNDDCPEGYKIQAKGQDYEIIAKAWNQGIDSHLEAMTERSEVNGPNFTIHPDELHTLVRRLMEMWEEQENEDAYQLAFCICETLKIELI